VHGGEFGAQFGEAGDFGVEVGDVPGEQGSGGFAGAGAGVPDGEQVADFGEAEAEALAALDEPQPVDGGLRPAAVVAAGARGGGQQADAFVVADGVGADLDPVGQGRIRSAQR
jgi:hypothetical protein